LQVKVPCVIVFGKQEEKTGNVQLRSESESQNRTLTIEQMKKFLSERVLESQ
jgi:threonyl-tRNA synthetase